MSNRHVSDSSEQRSAETFAVDALVNLLGVALRPLTLTLPDGCRVEIDAASEGPTTVLAEVYAHQGKLKGSQPTKLLADAFKLAAVRQLLRLEARLLLVLTDEAAAAGLRKGWKAGALAAFGIEVVVVPLPPAIAAGVRAAQERQQMKNVAE